MSHIRNNSAQTEPVAVVSVGAIFPGRGDTSGFWRDIVEGVDTFTSVPESHWLKSDYYDSDPKAADRTYGDKGGFIKPTSFDPLSFGIPPTALSSTDTAQLLALVAARSILDDIETHTGQALNKSNASVILGVASTTELAGQMFGRLQRPSWVKGMREAGLEETQIQSIADRISSNFVQWRESTFPGLLGNVVAGRIANRLDFGGSNYVTDAACASSLSAMQIAIHELNSGDSDLVLTGGVDALNDIFMYMCFSKTPALSPTGDCRPLSADADGTMLGEGIGMLALRRLSDAEKDGNQIHAVIKGLGAGSDGRATAVYAPLVSGQEKTLNRAYAKAGYSPQTVELVEAHGTGTVAGDRTELQALHNVFDPENNANKPWCAIGSVKSQIGHTKAAAGAAGLLKVIGGLSRKILPPTIKVREPAEALAGKSPFYISTKARPWIRGSAHPRRASVSSFGFGGSNFHVTLEEYTGEHAAQPARVMPAELLLISANSAKLLCERALDLSRKISHEDELSAVANESWSTFNAHDPHRAALVAKTPEHLEKLCEKLRVLANKSPDTSVPADPCLHYSSAAVQPGKLALLFSGQGSQYLGMGADLAMAFPTARAVWDSACDNSSLANRQLHDIAFPATLFSQQSRDEANASLTSMQNAQPAIAAVALSQLSLLKQLGVQADMQAGHSFGEVMALHSAGVFDSTTALSIACDRAEAMNRAASANTGSMLAVQSSADVVIKILGDHMRSITLANDNAPSQVVLSGEAHLLEQAASQLQGNGINSQRLQVAAAFHSPHVEPAVVPFAQRLHAYDLRRPTSPVFANTTACVYPSDKNALVKMLSEQIGKPVLFRQTLQAMQAQGVTTFLEVGPGSVLTNLVRQTCGNGSINAIAMDNKHLNGTSAFLSAIGQLSVAGVALNLHSLFSDLPAAPARPQPGKHAVQLKGSNYGKPYPVQTQQTPIQPGEQSIPDSANGSAQHSGSTVKTNGSSHPTATDVSLQGNSTVHETNPSYVAASHCAQASHSQQLAATTQPMAMENSTTVRPDTNSETCLSSTSHLTNASQTSHQSVADNRTSADAGSTSSAAARGLFDEISARHADYLAAITAAHQSYLSLSASIVNDVDASTLLDAGSDYGVHLQQPQRPVAQVQAPAHSASNGAAASAAPVNGHAPQLNGNGALNGSAMTNGAGTLNGSIAVNGAHAAPTVASGNGAHPESVSMASPNPQGMATLASAAPSTAPQAAPIAQAAPAPVAVSTPATVAAQAPVAAPAPAAAPASHSANGAAQTRISTDLVRSLIADKTGYPVEMIEDDMDLSGELGIDSIKQVEVLSALRTQVPEIKDVGSADIGQLRTIRQIADFFG